MNSLKINLTQIRERIATAATRAGRSPDDITLVAVGKTQPAEAIAAAYHEGLRHFGENRVEEARTKIPQVHELLAQAGLSPQPSWHMVGHVQSRKASTAYDLFDMLHSLDSVKLARKLSRYCQESTRLMPVLLEMNVSGEESKHGFRTDEDDPTQWEALLASVSEILSLPGIEVQGLMTMAPVVADPEQARPFFARLRALREELAKQFPKCSWKHLSMGMTDDFEVAVEEGATILRIGRAIFGSRQR